MIYTDYPIIPPSILRFERRREDFFFLPPRRFAGGFPLKIGRHFFTAALNARCADFGVEIFALLTAATRHFLYFVFDPFREQDLRGVLRLPLFRTM
jgi:hypothetical protein